MSLDEKVGVGVGHIETLPVLGWNTSYLPVEDATVTYVPVPSTTIGKLATLVGGFFGQKPETVTDTVTVFGLRNGCLLTSDDYFPVSVRTPFNVRAIPLERVTGYSSIPLDE